MTDHLKTLRELVAAGEENGARDCLVLELRAALLHKFRERTDEGKSFDGADLDSILREYALTMAERADDIADSANARPALAALLRVVEAAKELAESCNTFESTEYTPDGGWRRVLRKGYDPEKLIAFDAALRDLEPKEAPDA